MMLGIVEYLPQLDPSRQVGDLLIGSIRLLPGKNSVDIDLWRQIAELPLVKQRIEAGIIRAQFDSNPSIIIPAVSSGVSKGKNKDSDSKVTRQSTPIETELAPVESIPEAVETPAPIIPVPLISDTKGAKK